MAQAYPYPPPCPYACCAQQQQHRGPYISQSTFIPHPHTYPEQFSRQYSMQNSRPSSSDYDQKPMFQDQTFQPQEPHQYQQYASQMPQQSYTSHWASMLPDPGTMPPGHTTEEDISDLPYQTAYPYNTTAYTPSLGYGPLPSQQDYVVPPPDTYGAIFNEPSPVSGFGGLYQYQNMNETLSQYHQHEDLPLPHGSEPEIFGCSPPDGFHDHHSVPNSDSSWSNVDPSSPRSSLESYVEVPRSVAQAPMGTSIDNPGIVLWRNHHNRTDSDSSAEEAPPSASSLDSFGIFAMDSPTIQHMELTASDTADSNDAHGETDESSTPSSPETSRRPTRNPGSTSPLQARAKKHASSRSNGRVSVRSSAKAETSTGAVEKRGRRKGPLSVEQRKEASDVRKLGSCYRCSDLKKKCDGGFPCRGCVAAHSRLWNLPCYRGLIHELGYFVRDWTADFTRHHTLAIPPDNATDCSLETGVPAVQKVWITHGYGYMFPVYVREVCFRDNSYSLVSWAETTSDDTTRRYNVPTANWKIHSFERDVLPTYLKSHLGKNFPLFVRDHFQGTRFLTDMLLTANRFWMRTKDPIVGSALEFLVAYNLTTAVTFVASPEGTPLREGMIRDPTSAYRTQMAAPMLINQEIKAHLARMWRELQLDVMRGLELLFDKVKGRGKYAKDRSKKDHAWPTLLVVGSLLLAVWEEMQFDARYREPDPEIVNSFCDSMVEIPVKFIVGLMYQIGSTLPGLKEWNTVENGAMLNHDQAACAVMSEIRDSVTEHDEYLQTRPDAEFDPEDFDSLSNKFVSQLVLRPATPVK